jgi:hypothetical protein
MWQTVSLSQPRPRREVGPVPETDELSVLADTSRYLFQSIRLIRGADLSAATPCPDWHLRQLLRHIHPSLEEFTDILAVREFNADTDTDTDADAGPRPGVDPVAALRAGIVELLLGATSLPTAGR